MNMQSATPIIECAIHPPRSWVKLNLSMLSTSPMPVVVIKSRILSFVLVSNASIKSNFAPVWKRIPNTSKTILPNCEKTNVIKGNQIEQSYYMWSVGPSIWKMTKKKQRRWLNVTMYEELIPSFFNFIVTNAVFFSNSRKNGYFRPSSWSFYNKILSTVKSP